MRSVPRIIAASSISVTSPAEAKKAELTNCSILADMTGSWRMRWATISRELLGERNSSVTWA